MKAVVGTINLITEPVHHFECAAYLYGGPTVGDEGIQRRWSSAAG
ncbi:MAG: hypothetical protein ACLUIX_05950 [Oscillospiraceae bacterium]